ncbi:unnamed protein product, partial [Pocillopora meandrina]
TETRRDTLHTPNLSPFSTDSTYGSERELDRRRDNSSGDEDERLEDFLKEWPKLAVKKHDLIPPTYSFLAEETQETPVNAKMPSASTSIRRPTAEWRSWDLRDFFENG